jgi:hypothetical protein
VSTYAADAQVSLLRTSKANLYHFRITAVLGAAGVVVAPTTGQDGASDPGVTLTKNGGATGQYDLTYPASPGYVAIDVAIYSPAQTIGQFAITARNYAAGTASIMFSSKAGANAYGASGDELIIDLFAETRPKT